MTKVISISEYRAKKNNNIDLPLLNNISGTENMVKALFDRESR